MVKQKLINKRKSQKISQESMAFSMGITQSQYCRRENGITKISKTEWLKLAEILKTTLFEIYESEDDIYSNSKIDSLFSDTFNEQSHKVITMTKHIQKLEIENKSLKEEVAQLQCVILVSISK
jgi:transcriptional regulator with XRE-family HTH domain